MRKYYARTLFDGKKAIGKEGMFVGVPDKGYKGQGSFIVVYRGTELQVDDWEKAIAFRTFKDKAGGADYILGYFRWDL